MELYRYSETVASLLVQRCTVAIGSASFGFWRRMWIGGRDTSELGVLRGFARNFTATWSAGSAYHAPLRALKDGGDAVYAS